MPLAADNQDRRYIAELDCVRGTAIAMILLYHHLYITAVAPPEGWQRHALAALRMTWTGVDLFSGWLLLMLKSASMCSPFMQTVGYTWVALFFVLLILYALTQESSLVGWALRRRWLRWLGRIAYGVYLLHCFVLLFVTGWISPGHQRIGAWPALESWRQFGVTVVSLVVTLGLCRLSWRYFEKPLVQLGHRWTYETGTRNRR